MVKSEEDVAYDILEHVVWSGLFNSRRCEIALRLTIVGEWWISADANTSLWHPHAEG